MFGIFFVKYSDKLGGLVVLTNINLGLLYLDNLGVIIVWNISYIIFLWA
jgi:hypothetical protein